MYYNGEWDEFKTDPKSTMMKCRLEGEKIDFDKYLVDFGDKDSIQDVEIRAYSGDRGII